MVNFFAGPTAGHISDIYCTWYATPLKATGADASFCFRCHPVRKSRITLLRSMGLSCGNMLRLIPGLGKF